MEVFMDMMRGVWNARSVRGRGVNEFLYFMDRSLVHPDMAQAGRNYGREKQFPPGALVANAPGNAGKPAFESAARRVGKDERGVKVLLAHLTRDGHRAFTSGKGNSLVNAGMAPPKVCKFL